MFNLYFEELMGLVSDNPPQVDRLKALRTAHADWQSYARRMIDLRDGGLPGKEID